MTSKIDWNTILQNAIARNTPLVQDNDGNNDTDAAAQQKEQQESAIIPVIKIDTDCFVAVIPTFHRSTNPTTTTTTTTTKKTKKPIIDDEPSSDTYPYQITVIATWMETTITTTTTPTAANSNSPDYTIHFYCINESTISHSFYTLLRHFNTTTATTTIINETKDNDCDCGWNITIQTFAQQPRRHFPNIYIHEVRQQEEQLQQDHDVDTCTTKNPCCLIRAICIRYFTITQSIFNGWNDDKETSGTGMNIDIEFTQCTIAGHWNTVLSCNNNSFHHHHHRPDDDNNDISSSLPSSLSLPLLSIQLTVSCTMPEFQKMITEYLSIPSESTEAAPTTTQITELNLLLHFTLTDALIQDFCTALCCSTSSRIGRTLQLLSIQYLDISDNGWEILCTSLIQSASIFLQFHTLSLSYTDSFVDAYRRISLDRCTKRTQQILDVVLAIPSIRYVDFPQYQQNLDIMMNIQSILQERQKILK